MPPIRKRKNDKENVTVPAFEGKLPPQALDMERAVIGAMMIERDAYDKVCEILNPNSFYDTKLGKIYQAIVDLSVKEEPVDLMTVSEQLKKNGTFEEVGGDMALMNLTENVGSAAHIEYHARIVADKNLARELIRLSSDVLSSAYNPETDIDELMNSAEGRLFEVSQKNVKKDFVKVSSVITEARQRIDAAAQQKEGISGLATGFEKLDEMTAGWQPSDLIIIAARPAMGKTAFVLSMAKNIAVDMGQPVGLFSLEMSNVQLTNRLISNVCEIDSKNIKTGRLTGDEWRRLEERIKLLEDAKLYLDDTPSLSVFELRTKARRLVKEYGVKLIIIDYLQLMNANGMNFGSREQEVSTISRSLKGLAKELDIPIIALSQLNRSVESRVGAADKGKGARPQLSDLRESGAIEQDADMVCFIHRPEYYKIYEDEKGESLQGIAEIIIAKHRNGAVGDVRLRFRGEMAKFMNLTDESYSFGYDNSTYADSRLNNRTSAPSVSAGGDDVLASQSDKVPF
ncbi:MAG: replicative DNA helicase [Paludibacteraceae bacterium]|nr:replicative DNA helicase [Paludibacteraceae bacterium]MBP5742292.1 replicative DNA helicase [Paludibacteraceae bacterium]